MEIGDEGNMNFKEYLELMRTLDVNPELVAHTNEELDRMCAIAMQAAEGLQHMRKEKLKKHEC